MKHDMQKRQQMRQELFKALSDHQLSFAEALIKCRYITAKNQKEYAELVGVSKKIISDIELGRANPTIETINKVFAPVGLKAGLVTK